jgi:cytochrome c-type biogenesis protein CcmH/NrfG
MMAARRARTEALKVEAPRALRAGNVRRALELCRAWVDLDLGNAEAWRCLGRAQFAAGDHQEALNAYRKARQHAPGDRTIDADVERAQQAIVNDFLARYRR